jgi:hypothetical protein
MANPEISLNTKNASNLYVVDYYGGSGGETLGEVISAAMSCEFTRNKTPTDGSSIDSFRNFLVMPYVNDGLKDILLRGRSGTDKFNGDTLLKNMLIMYHWQDKEIDPNLVNYENVFDTKITKNVLMRNHLPERDWSSLPNRHHIHIYPSIDDCHITVPQMFKKQYTVWSEETKEYRWQESNRLLNFGCKTFNEFVDYIFYNTKTHKTIEQVDTSYGINITPKEFVYGLGDWEKKLEEYIGAKVNIPNKWQQNNLRILEEMNLTIDSTEQECIDRIKDVYS